MKLFKSPTKIFQRLFSNSITKWLLLLLLDLNRQIEDIGRSGKDQSGLAICAQVEVQQEVNKNRRNSKYYDHS